MTHNSEDEDEKSLFQRHMRDVKPLKQSPQIPHHKTPPPPLQKKRREHHVRATTHSSLSDPYLLEIEAETVISYHQTGLIKKRIKPLQSGNFFIEARLDLHGQNIDQARESLHHFIKTSFQKNARQLLIIHGKGGQLQQMAILKSHVAHWLKQFSEVLAFQSAHPKDGGTGAVYVLLKKNK